MSSKNQSEVFNENNDEFLLAAELATGSLLQMVFKAAIELNLIEIIGRAGPGKQLSATEIAALLPTQNPDAPEMLDRMLRLLACYSIFTCTHQVVSTGDDHNQVQRLYGLGPVCKYFVSNEDGVSFSPLLLMNHHKAYMEGWYHLKDAVIEGGIPFNKGHGMQLFEYLGLDPTFNEIFNKSMVNLSITLMKAILEIYGGFEKANVVVDVGGGLGRNLELITSKYPNIKGINFDLPHVIANAPASPGVEHVAGDMFFSVPKGDIIFMKMIVHDWRDEHCLKLLKNCYEALPEDGKVVIVEKILPAAPETNLLAKVSFGMDLTMMAQTGGMERTEKEYMAMAKGAGFNACRFTCCVLGFTVMEFLK